jgi:hypothetical protein
MERRRPRRLARRRLAAAARENAARAMHGAQTHTNSLRSVATPRGEKKPAPMGETRIGLHGKK